MILTAQLKKGYTDVLGKPIRMKDAVIGHIISYDAETGIGVFELDGDIEMSDVFQPNNISNAKD